MNEQPANISNNGESDAELVARAQRGDRRAVHQLVRNYTPKLSGRVSNITANRATTAPHLTAPSNPCSSNLS